MIFVSNLFQECGDRATFDVLLETVEQSCEEDESLFTDGGEDESYNKVS